MSTEIDLNAKETITDIKSTLSICFKQIRFGKDSKEAYDNIVKFKSIVDNLTNGEVSENIEVFNDADDDNNDTFQCKLDFDKIIELERINIDGSLSKVFGEWCYTFYVYFDVSSDDYDDFLIAVHDVERQFDSFGVDPCYEDTSIVKYTGMVDKNSVMETVEGEFYNRIQFAAFVDAYE